MYWKNGDTWHKFEVKQEALAFFDRKKWKLNTHQKPIN
ncbi:hypothetical protein BN927_00847 [Lactococcus lactis subsp. lactis Dephy 1]|nr:hypothetical protein BN927_00847 [Lactococcus lactis subsp. lactis Dephy 1]